jgi:hypothetical protein
MATKTENVLDRITITQDGPGTVLRDFETLLDFVGVDGIKTGGKHHLIPMGRLKELDARMTHPLEPPLKRPQQRSFPHIQGLYLLLRATMLGVASGSGSKARLSIDPHMLSLWQDLNPTEKYFNLLEAWLLRGSTEMLGDERGGWSRGFLTDVLQQRARAFRRSRSSGSSDVREKLGLYSHEKLCQFALQELFGFVEIERGTPDEGENWRIASARWTDFGHAMLELLQEDFVNSLTARSGHHDEFGQWQPIFAEHFPEWRKSLAFPEPEFRNGVHVFKVSWGKVWRRLIVPATADMDELANTIIDAYDFDGDHLYGFYLRNPDGTRLTIDHPYCDGERFTDEVPVGAAPMEVGDAFTFLYDFGAGWQFTVKLEKIDPPDPGLKHARIVQSHGDSPPEYDFEDDCWDDEDDD